VTATAWDALGLKFFDGVRFGFSFRCGLERSL
jgi:hypothetical protein